MLIISVFISIYLHLKGDVISTNDMSVFQADIFYSFNNLIFSPFYTLPSPKNSTDETNQKKLAKQTRLHPSG